MKNILIPSTLQNDTINAVKAGIHAANGNQCQLILMVLADIPDTFSSASLLRNINTGLTSSQENILDECRQIASETNNCNFKIHHQYGISSPVFKNLVSHFNISLTIITPSFKSSQKKINSLCVQIVSNSKCPILHTNVNFDQEIFSQALYIKNSDSQLHAQDLQASVNTLFPLKIVSESDTNLDQPFLNETITKNNINILIETRKPKKLKLLTKQKAALNELLGLPVLSLYEEIY